MKLILNADDFGRSPEINSAIIRAHREGVLTSASLMVAGAAAEQAVELAKQNPQLAVGLHLVAVDGPAVLPARHIPHLVDSNDSFANAPVRLGLSYVFNPRARRELAAEVEAQFARFARFGLPLSHVDGHQHMHMHPVVFDLLVPLASHYGAGGIRVVHDDLRLALRYDGRHAVSRTIGQAIFRMLARRCRHRLAGTRLAHADRTFGFHRSGGMTEEYVLCVMDHLRHECNEVYFHPTEGDRLDVLGPNQEDLRALLSPAVRRRIRAHALQPATYRDFARQSTSGVPEATGESEPVFASKVSHP